MTNTPYHVKIGPTSLKQIRALAHKEQKIMTKMLEALSVNPHPPIAYKIEGMIGLYCQPVNHLRLIYKVEEQEVLLLLVK